MDVLCKHVWIIEWYDGIVQGVIEDYTGYWYVSLQAFDATHCGKLYAAVQINTSLTRMINIETGAPLQISDSLLEGLLMTGKVFVTNDEPREGARIKLKPVTDAERQRLRGGGFQVENAVSEESVKFWLSHEAD